MKKTRSAIDFFNVSITEAIARIPLHALLHYVILKISAFALKDRVGLSNRF